MDCVIRVNNFEEYAKDRKWVVIRMYEDEAWFYDAWDEDHKEDAYKQAHEVDGIVVERK